MVVERRVFDVAQIVHAEILFRPRCALLGQIDRLLLFVQLIIRLGPKSPHKGVRPGIERRAVVARARDDERRARLVDQDGVHLVHNGIAKLPLHEILPMHLHVVAQIVKAEFVIRTIGDVRRIGALLCGDVRVAFQEPHRKAQKAVQPPHPFAVAPRQVFVDRDNMHAPPPKRVQAHGQRGHERLALARLHFRDIAVVQDDPA